MKRPPRMLPLLFALICAALLPPSAAQALPIRLGETITLRLDGHVQGTYSNLGKIEIDREGTTLGDGGAFHNRLRFAPALLIGKTLEIRAEMDLVSTGELYAAPSDVGKDLGGYVRPRVQGFRPFAPRKLYLEWRSAAGMLRIGQCASQWGLGLLSSSGDRDPEFGTARYGDLVERVFFVTWPLKLASKASWASRLHFALGFDLVFRDENAYLMDGDLALQGVASLFWRQKGLFAGAYFAIRGQEDDDGDKLEATVIDLFLRWSHQFGKKGPTVDLAGELVFLRGFSDRMVNEAAPDGVDLAAMGAVVRAGVKVPSFGLRIAVEGGYASGDNDTGDGTSRTMSFDPDYRVGLLLFRQVMNGVSARGAERAGDPNRVGTPAKGTEQAATWGRVSNTFYLRPLIAWRPAFGPRALRNLEVKAALLLARTAAEFSDPYESFRAGGANRTIHGLPSADRASLGTELDLAVSYLLKLTDSIKIAAVFEYAILFPGAAFEKADGSKPASVNLIQARLRVRF